MNAAAGLLAAVEIGDPLTRGSLALFPLFHERPPAAHYITGPRSDGHVQIGEVGDGAVVPELEIGNESDWPILLLDGETLLGARQNRIVTASVLVAPRTKTRVSVTCVEAGRWGEERPVGRSGLHAPSGVRARNRASVNASVESGRGLQPDQAGVWEEVAGYSARFGVTSPTSAMEDVHGRAAGGVHALVGGTKPLPGQCGVAAAVGGRVIAVDLFDDPQTLADYWDALVAGYALDAEPKAAKHPRRREVRALLGTVAAGRATTAGERVHIDADGATATALVLGDTVVHLGVSTLERATTRSWFSG